MAVEAEISVLSHSGSSDMTSDVPATHPFCLRLGLFWISFGMFVLSGCRPPGPEHGTVFVLKVDPAQSSAPQNLTAGGSEAEAALHQRFEKLGFALSLQRPKNAPDLLHLTTSAGGEDLPILRKLVTQPGRMRFAWVHPESQKRLEQNDLPPGYAVFREFRRSPQGQEMVIRHLVSTQAIDGLSNANLKQVAISKWDPLTQTCELTLEWNEVGRRAFAEATAQNQGNMLAVLVDNTLVCAPVIRARIENGQAVISSLGSEREAQALAAVLRHPIQARMNLVEERSF